MCVCGQIRLLDRIRITYHSMVMFGTHACPSCGTVDMMCAFVCLGVSVLRAIENKKKWRNPSCGEAERKNNMEKYGLVIFHVVRIGITSFRIYTWFAAFCMCLTRPSQWLVVGWGASHTIAGTGNKSPCRVIKIRHNTGHCMNLNSKVVHAS